VARCPACAKEIDPAARSCRYCGRELVVRRRDKVLDRLTPAIVEGRRLTPRRAATRAAVARLIGSSGTIVVLWLVLDELPPDFRAQPIALAAAAGVLGALFVLRREVFRLMRGNKRAPSPLIDRELRRHEPWWMTETARIAYWFLLFLLFLIPLSWTAVVLGGMAGVLLASAFSALAKRRSLPPDDRRLDESA
jgi:hypothetical protein